MPTLYLARMTEIDPDPADGIACCVVEPRKNVSKGYVAAISPAGPRDEAAWRRRFLDRTGQSYIPRRSATLHVFAGLADGTYEAHSTLRSGLAHRTVFRVERGAIAIVCDQEGAGPAEAVLEALGWEAPAAPDDGLPPLRGTTLQVDYARKIRTSILSRARARRPDLAATLALVVDATYFIANKVRPLDEWPRPAARQLAGGPLA